jgi:hypothetical protein
MVSTRSVSRADNGSFKTIALFCLIGLVASFGLTSFGVDLGASWV